MSVSNNTIWIASNYDVTLIPRMSRPVVYSVEELAKEFGVRTRYEMVLMFVPLLSTNEYLFLRWKQSPFLYILKNGVNNRGVAGVDAKTIYGEAIRGYEQNRFVEDGSLEIDNNLIENSIRPSALGKRNWMFIGHPAAGDRSAVIYTLGSCRRQAINPFDYLKDLFTRLPAAKITQIKDFTPAAWAKAKTKEKMLAQAA